MSRPDHHLRFFTQNLGNLYAEYKNKNLKILPTLSAKTISLENVFFLGDLYATHSTKTEYSPFSILSVFETRSCRESTLTDHPIYFVPRSYEYFTCTYYTSWTFPLCVQICKIVHAHITPFQLSPFPSVLIVHLFMNLGAHLFWRKTWFVWGIDMWQRNKLKVPGHHCNWPHIEGKTLVGRYSRHFCHVLPVKVDSGQSTNWTFHTLHRPANIEHWKTFDALIGCAGTVSLNFVTSSHGMLWRATNFLQNILGLKKSWWTAKRNSTNILWSKLCQQEGFRKSLGSWQVAEEERGR